MTDFANKIETNIDDTFEGAEWYWTKFKQKNLDYAYKYADEDNFEKIQDLVNRDDTDGRAKKKKDVETLKSLFGYPDKCATKKSRTQE